MPRLVIGCMTGTSLDALDVAAVAIDGNGLTMTGRVRATATAPLGAIADPLRALAEQQPMSAGRIAEVASEFAGLHVAAIEALLRRSFPAGERPDLIVVHGQTVYHAPPVSWQLFQPASLAHVFQCPVACDLRAADLAAGGQGAPITPLSDWVLLRGPRPRAILNLGGFANFTLLDGDRGQPAEEQLPCVRGGDLCACNHLLDGLARVCLNSPFDEDGRVAAAGQVRPDLLNELMHLLRGQRQARRSLGTGDELASWVRERAGDAAAGDLLRSACAALAEAIAAGLRETIAEARLEAVEQVLVAGGAVRNAAFSAELRARLGVPLNLCDACGVPSEYREAIGMAVLGALSADGVAITLPQITGRSSSARSAGAWCGGTVSDRAKT
jgi:1,6-anhydro-N-acetylmuramate kinase